LRLRQGEIQASQKKEAKRRLQLGRAFTLCANFYQGRKKGLKKKLGQNPESDQIKIDVSIDYYTSDIQFLGNIHFLSGMYPMTNSRNCTCQQSSVNCQDQCVRMIGPMQNMSANMHECRMHVRSIALQLRLAEC